MQEPGLQVEFKLHVREGRKRKKEVRSGLAPAPKPVAPGNIPRISKLMALAIHFDGLIQNRHVADYADLARLGHVTRARISQIMNLLNLAPDIQEDILFLPRVLAGKDPVTEHQVREIAVELSWLRQREKWANILIPVTPIQLTPLSQTPTPLPPVASQTGKRNIIEYHS